VSQRCERQFSPLIPTRPPPPLFLSGFPCDVAVCHPSASMVCFSAFPSFEFFFSLRTVKAMLYSLFFRFCTLIGGPFFFSTFGFFDLPPCCFRRTGQPPFFPTPTLIRSHMIFPRHFFNGILFFSLFFNLSGQSHSPRFYVQRSSLNRVRPDNRADHFHLLDSLSPPPPPPSVSLKFWCSLVIFYVSPFLCSPPKLGSPLSVGCDELDRWSDPLSLPPFSLMITFYTFQEFTEIRSPFLIAAFLVLTFFFLRFDFSPQSIFPRAAFLVLEILFWEIRDMFSFYAPLL